MLAKHLVSVFDMVDGIEYQKTAPISQWDEKTLDSINYMILLKALIIDRQEEYEKNKAGILSSF